MDSPGALQPKTTKKRPVFLTVWLILIAAVNLLTCLVYVFSFTALQKQFPDAPAWAFIILLLGTAINVAAAVLLWKWKIIGFYLIIAMACVSLFTNIIILGVKPAGIAGYAGAVVGPLILYLAMRPVWQNFK